LRSAGKLINNTVFLISLNDIDFSFIRNLSGDVIFCLQALMLHEKMDAWQFASVSNLPQKQAYMLLMRLKDRGIVIELDDNFAMNPLLYRHISLLLKDKNLIH